MFFSFSKLSLQIDLKRREVNNPAGIPIHVSENSPIIGCLSIKKDDTNTAIKAPMTYNIPPTIIKNGIDLLNCIAKT